jgi:hypothetical protein
MNDTFEPNLEQINALHSYASKFGSIGEETWKTHLMDDWMTGRDDGRENGHLLRQMRNRGGPTWLNGYDLPHIPPHPDDEYNAYVGDLSKGLALIPQHCRTGMHDYIMDGRRPGDFLQAVLRNDFMDAVCRADADNRFSLIGYAHLLHNYAPDESYGSRTRVDAWVGHGGWRGRTK